MTALTPTPDEIRAELERLLTTDSEHQDRRRRGYNQAIFAPANDGGWAVWDRTDLDMVLDKYDHAVRNLTRKGKKATA